MVSLAAAFSSLAFLNTGSLFQFTVELLNLPTDGARFSDAIS